MLKIVSAGLTAFLVMGFYILVLATMAVVGFVAQAFFTYLVIPIGSTWPIWLVVFAALGAIFYEK